jgi:hypothetical protein
MSFAFGRPSCGRALRCVGAPNFRTCRRALRLRCRRALGHPTCGCALRCVGAPNFRTCLAMRWGAQLPDMPCVAFGRPSCGRALRCIGAPNLGEALLKSLPPSQNLFLSILQLVFSLVLPCVDVFVADRFFVWAPILRMRLALRLGAHLATILRTCLALHWGAQLADVQTCLALRRSLRLRCRCALGRPTCGHALRCVGAPNLRTCLVLHLGAHLADVPCVALGCPTLVRPY